MPQVIFFDLDETLVAQETAFEQAYRSTAEWLAREAIAVDPVALASEIPIAAERALRASPLAATIRRCRFGGRDLLWGNPGNGAGATQAITQHIDAFRIAAWDTLLDGYSISGTGLTAELNRRFRAAMFAALRLYPDVRSALERLTRDYALSVITNGMGAAQREKLVHLGIDGHFHSVIASAEIGVGKPAVQIFEAAVQALDVGPDEALMVGDSLEGDIEGARSVGLRAVWLNRLERATSSPLSRRERTRPGEGLQISSLADWSPPVIPPPEAPSPTRTSSEPP